MSEDSNGEVASDYDVEYILAAKFESNEWKYLTKWWGYSETQNSWEPARNLDSCAELLDSFWNHVGRERKHLKKSKLIVSSQPWREEQTERTKELMEMEEKEDMEQASNRKKDFSTDDETPLAPKLNLSRSVQNYIREPPKKPKSKHKETSADRTKSVKASSVSKTKGTEISSSKSTSSLVRPLKRRRAISDSDSSSSSKMTNRKLLLKGDETSEDDVSSSFHRKSAPNKRLRMNSSDDDDDGPSEMSKTVTTAPSETAMTIPSESAVTAPSEPAVTPPSEPVETAPSVDVATALSVRPLPELVANAPLGPIIGAPTNRTTPVSSPRRRDSGSSSDGTPLSATVSRPTPPTLHGKTVLKPIEPVIDKHRGNRMKILPTPVTQVSSLSTKLSVAGGSAARASSQPKSPVVSTSSIRKVQTEGQASPTDETLTRTFDLPVGLKAQDQMVPLPLEELSPFLNTSSTVKPKPPGRRGAVDVTDAMSKMLSNSIASNFEPAPTPVPVFKENTMRMTKKWVGSLILGESAYCQVNLETLSASVAEKAMPAILASLNGRLQASATFPAAGIAHQLLPAFKLPVEFAKIGPADSDNANRLERLLTYMEFERQISVFQPNPMFPTTYFVLHPSTLAEATVALGTPKAIQNGPPTLAIAMLLKRRERGFSSHNLIQSLPHNPAVLLPRDADIPSYQRIARYFGLTKRLLDYLSGRTFCVFAVYGEKHLQSMPVSADPFDDPETAALTRLLTRCGARRVDWRDNSNFIVFVHGRAWLSSDMPVPDPLLNRGKSYLIQYFKFGTSLNFLPGENRFVREAFPLGGVLSLTARAMADDPDGILDLIDKVGSHPLWQVYLLPETLGLLFHALSDAEVSSGAVVTIGGLLARLRIPESKLTIASCPPQLSSESFSVDSVFSWEEMQSSIADLYNNPPALLDYCANCLRTTYAHLINAPLAQLEAAVQNDCIRDLANLQRQPALYTRHREFVLIVPGRGHNGPGPSKDHGVAIHTLQGFVFSDDVNPSDVRSTFL